MSSLQQIRFHRHVAGQWEARKAVIIREAHVALSVNGELWLTLMCTPEHLEALALGFLFNEGLIHSHDEVLSVRVCPRQENVDVMLNHTVSRPQHWGRTSGCSGGSTTAPVPLPLWQTTHAEVRIQPEALSALMELLSQSQVLYRESGGVHASALSDGSSILFQAEDIGRHNTLDKIAGHLLMEPPPVKPCILMTTGRISSEMLQKAARMSVPILMSRSSPSDLSIRLAEDCGMTLVGYSHHAQFNVYSHPERIDGWPG